MSDLVPIAIPESQGDLLLGCIGYEDRSTFLLRTTPERSSSIFFDYKALDSQGKGICAYDNNIKVAQGLRVTLESDFEIYLRLLESEVLRLEPVSVDFDVTSLDRGKIGRIILKLFALRKHISSVTFIYAPRIFRPFDMYKFDVVQSFGPALPAFFGTADGLNKPLTLILGAGYEYGKAVGAIDTLEPDHIFCFRPTGTDPLFDLHIDLANVDFSFIENKENIFPYDLNDAYRLYHSLRTLVSYEIVDQNVLLLPLGPKLFAAISMLIATDFHPDVMVWRHSTASTNLPETIDDAETTGKLVKFSFRFK